jgi:hypothetical protein
MPRMSERWVEFARIWEESRNKRNAYYEKLAILDGGTVALTITAVLGPLHGTITHRYTLLAGLTALVLAMLALIRRNLVAVHQEMHIAANTYTNPEWLADAAKRGPRGEMDKEISTWEMSGLVLSGLGVSLLLVEVWLLLW